VTSTKSGAAAAVSIGAGLALRKRNELLGLLRPCFARTGPWLQAGKYVPALASDLPRGERLEHRPARAAGRLPREHIEDPVKSLVMGLPLDLAFRTKGQLAIDISTEAAADGIRPDFYCGDEVCGSCTELRGHLETEGQAYVLRVPSNFMLTLAAGTTMTCAEAARAFLRPRRRWEVRSAGQGSKGDRWYAWAWIGTASPRHHLLVRRHLRTGDLAFHYCYVPEGQLLTKTRLIRAAAGLVRASPGLAGLGWSEENVGARGHGDEPGLSGPGQRDRRAGRAGQ
jgi:DDE superfamily endonuclease